MLLALVGGTVSASAQAAPVEAAAPVDCPKAVPMAAVTKGLVGEGHTVVTGSTPEPFRVEVLGVLAGYNGGGRDLILVKVSDLPGGAVVSQAGGIWEGMSGSPVYVGGKLLGAVSGGFTIAPSPIGVVTPAADMLDLFGPAGAKTARTGRPAAKQTIELSAATRRQLGAAAGTAAPRGSLQQLTTPLGVSGLGSKRIARLQRSVDSAGLNLSVHAAGGSQPTASRAPAARPHAGGNFAAVLSTGDVATFGYGTTTAVCSNQAIAFGHPIDLAGPVSYGAADADSLGIIEDETNGAFKMATLGASFGTLDQDRSAGIRADLTRTPSSTDVTTSITDTDNGAARTGITHVLDRSSLPGLLPYMVFANQDAVFDEWNDGTARSDWTIRGTRAHGVAFSVSRANLWASRGDVTIDPAVDVAIAAGQLLNNDFENVKIDSVSFGSSMSTVYQQLHISRVQVSVNGGAYTTPKRLSLAVGAKLRLKISLSPYRRTTATTTTLALTVPKSARGQSGLLLASGGVDRAAQSGSGEECFLFGEGCGDSGASSFAAIMKSIETAPKNNQVVAELLLESQRTGDTVTAAKKGTSKGLTVTGQRGIEISVRR